MDHPFSPLFTPIYSAPICLARFHRGIPLAAHSWGAGVCSGWMLIWGRELRVELRPSAGFEDDLHGAFLMFMNIGAGDDRLRQSVSDGILHFEGSAALNLKSIVEACIAVQSVGAKAGVGVVHFQQSQELSGAVFDRCLHMVRVAGSGTEQRQCAGAEQDAAGERFYKELQEACFRRGVAEWG